MKGRAAFIATVTFCAGVSGCASLTTTTMGQGQQEAVWVCHGQRNPGWQKVAAPAADGHRRHGDRVSSTPQEEGAACAR